MLKSPKSKIKYIISIFLISSIFIFFATKPENTEKSLVIGGNFNLVNQYGETKTLADFKNKYSLVFFGFTNCEMICPTSLNNMSITYEKLTKAQKEKLNIIFITIDPKRDTIPVLNDYLQSYLAPITGLTGSKEAINNVAKKYRIYAEEVEVEKNKFTISHTSFIYLLNEEGEFIDHFGHNFEIDMLYNKLNNLL